MNAAERPENDAAARRDWLVPGVLAAFVVAALLSAGFFLVVEEIRRNTAKEQARQLAATVAHDFSERLDRSLSASYALATLVRQGRGRIDNFDAIASEMLSLYGGISALQLAPDGRIAQVVPLAGNEAALGFSPLEDERQGPESRRVVAERTLGLTGPFELTQGGIGVVGRYPIFLPDAHGRDRFWGFTQVVVRIPDLLASTRIGALVEAGYAYELWRTRPDDGTRQVFSRGGGPLAERPVDARIKVPNGEWSLAVTPQRGWLPPTDLFVGFVGGLALSSLFAFAVYLLLRQPLVLQAEVARRTAELRAANQRYEQLNAELEARVAERTQRLQAEIEERRLIEAAVRRSAGWLSQIIETMSSGILLWDREQRLAVWNRAFGRVYPASAELLHVGLARDTLIQGMIARGEFGVAEDGCGDWDALGIWERRLADGRIIRIERLVTSEGGRLALHTDITDQHRTNEVLARNERLASLGSLVAGIAHEINTPIGNALMVASALGHRIDEFAASLAEGSLRRSVLQSFVAGLRESDDLLQRNLLRAANLIQNFKQVAVDQASDRRRVFDLATVLEEVRMTLLPRLKHSPHRLEMDVEVGVRLDSYPGAIGQIVTNLVENALLHAFADRADGGTIEIRAHSTGDGRAEIVFSDNGCGIPDELRARVFDPFFTTRLGQGGSGLGLSIVLNLVRDLLGGDIRLDDGVAGCRFVITLPLEAPPQAPAGESDDHRP